MTTASTNGQGDRTCGDCESGYFGPGGLFCMTYKEHIDDERVAQECVAFDPHPNVEYTAAPEPGRSRNIREALSTVVPGRELDDGLELDQLLAEPELVEACDAFLDARQCVLWGQPFEIISPKGRKQAAEWLAAQITGVGYVATVSQ